MSVGNYKFDYRLGTISQALNWKTPEGRIVSYEPYIREMRIWSELFRSVDIFAPLSNDKIMVTVSEYGFSNVDFTFVPYQYTTAWWGAFARFCQLPGILIKLTLFIWRHDILLIRSPSHFGLFAHLISYIMRKKTITKYAGFFSWFEGERLPSIVERNFIRWVLRPPHYTLVYGPSKAEHLISFIPAAISRAEMQELRSIKREASELKNKIIFYSLGKLLSVKNYDLAIRGLGLVYRENPLLEWEYHLIGDGVEAENLLRLARQFNIADRVFLEGRLSYIESMKKLATSDVVIMPGVKEGWPKVVIEGWAVGAVPLVADAGILPHVIQDGKNGFLFEPHEEQLKNKLLQIFEQPDSLVAIRKKGLVEVEKFSIEEFSKRVQDVCSKNLRLKLID